MKKTILLSMIAASLMADISIGEFKMKNPVMSAENLSVEHGGTKSMIDAYSDGVGVVVVGDYATLDNTPVNTLVYKYGEDAKNASASLPDYVLGLASASAKDKALAQKIKDNLASSTYVKNGDACDDGDSTTINDIYVNGVCQGIVAKSCKEIHNAMPSFGDGIYTINNGIKNYQVYCDMTYAGGGWTLISAQYENDPVPNWDEGIQLDYDPLLSTKHGFTLNSSEMPADRTELSMGQNLTNKIDYFTFFYTTDAIPKTTVYGSTANYHIYRNTTTANYDYNDPEKNHSPFLIENTEILTIDKLGGINWTWAFAPKQNTITKRGLNYNGSRLYLSSDPEAWTLWVR